MIKNFKNWMRLNEDFNPEKFNSTKDIINIIENYITGEVSHDSNNISFKTDHGLGSGECEFNLKIMADLDDAPHKSIVSAVCYADYNEFKDQYDEESEINMKAKINSESVIKTKDQLENLINKYKEHSVYYHNRRQDPPEDYCVDGLIVTEIISGDLL